MVTTVPVTAAVKGTPLRYVAHVPPSAPLTAASLTLETLLTGPTVSSLRQSHL